MLLLLLDETDLQRIVSDNIEAGGGSSGQIVSHNIEAKTASSINMAALPHASSFIATRVVDEVVESESIATATRQDPFESRVGIAGTVIDQLESASAGPAGTSEAVIESKSSPLVTTIPVFSSQSRATQSVQDPLQSLSSLIIAALDPIAAASNPVTATQEVAESKAVATSTMIDPAASSSGAMQSVQDMVEAGGGVQGTKAPVVEAQGVGVTATARSFESKIVAVSSAIDPVAAGSGLGNVNGT